MTVPARKFCGGTSTHSHTHTHTHTRTRTRTHAHTETLAPTNTQTHAHTRPRAHTRKHMRAHTRRNTDTDMRPLCTKEVARRESGLAKPSPLALRFCFYLDKALKLLEFGRERAVLIEHERLAPLLRGERQKRALANKGAYEPTNPTLLLPLLAARADARRIVVCSVAVGALLCITHGRCYAQCLSAAPRRIAW